MPIAKQRAPNEEPVRGIKIVSNGTRTGTTISDIETGNELKNIQKVEWEIDSSLGYGIATVTFFDVPVEAEGELQE